MILYSIIPLEIIFGSNEKNSESKYMEIDYLGEKVQVSQLENNQYVINRLISSSPKAFLNPKFQPGTMINGMDIKRTDI